MPFKRSLMAVRNSGHSESTDRILSKGHPFTQQKSRITFSGNPAIFFKIRGFPPLPHDGFGIY
jgi:hypothetical protein